MEGQPQHWRGLEHINYSCAEISPGHAKHSRSFRQEINNTDKQMQSTSILGASSSSGQSREISGDFAHSSTSYQFDVLPTVGFKGVGNVNGGYGRKYCPLSNYESVSGQNHPQLISSDQYVSHGQGISNGHPGIPGNEWQNLSSQRPDQTHQFADKSSTPYTADVYNINNRTNNEHLNCTLLREPTSSVHCAGNNNQLVLSVNERITESISHGTNGESRITESSKRNVPTFLTPQQAPSLQQGDGLSLLPANRELLNSTNDGFSFSSHGIYPGRDTQHFPSRYLGGQVNQTPSPEQRSVNLLTHKLPYTAHNFAGQENTYNAYISSVRHPVLSQSYPLQVQSQSNVNTSISVTASQGYYPIPNGESIDRSTLPLQKCPWSTESGQLTLGRTTDNAYSPYVYNVQNSPNVPSTVNRTSNTFEINQHAVQGGSYVSRPNFCPETYYSSLPTSGRFINPANSGAVAPQVSLNRPTSVEQYPLQNRYEVRPSLYSGDSQGYNPGTQVYKNHPPLLQNQTGFDRDIRGDFSGQYWPARSFYPVATAGQSRERNPPFRFQTSVPAFSNQSQYNTSSGVGSMGQNLQGVNNEGELPQSILTSFSNLGNFNAAEGNRDENASGTRREPSSDDSGSIFVKTEQLKEKIVSAFAANPETGVPQSETVKDDGRSSVDSGIGSLPSKISPNRRRLHRSNTVDGSSFFLTKDKARAASASSRAAHERFKTGSIDKKQAFLQRQEAVVVSSAAIPLPPPPEKYQEGLRSSTSASQLPPVSTSSPLHRPLQSRNSMPHAEPVNVQPTRFTPADDSDYHKVQPSAMFCGTVRKAQPVRYSPNASPGDYGHQRTLSQGSDVHYNANFLQQYGPSSSSSRNKPLGNQSWQSQGSLRISPDVVNIPGDSSNQVGYKTKFTQNPSRMPQTTLSGSLTRNQQNYSQSSTSKQVNPVVSHGSQPTQPPIHVFGKPSIPDARVHSSQPISVGNSNIPDSQYHPAQSNYVGHSNRPDTLGHPSQPNYMGGSNITGARGHPSQLNYMYQSVDNSQPALNQHHVYHVDNNNQRTRLNSASEAALTSQYVGPQNQFGPQNQSTDRSCQERPLRRYASVTGGQPGHIHITRSIDSYGPYKDSNIYPEGHQPAAVYNIQQSAPNQVETATIYGDSDSGRREQMSSASFVLPTSSYERPSPSFYPDNRSSNIRTRRSYPSSPEHPLSQPQFYYQQNQPSSSIRHSLHEQPNIQPHSYPPTLTDPGTSQTPTSSCTYMSNEAPHTGYRGGGVSYRDFQLSRAPESLHRAESQPNANQRKKSEGHYTHSSSQMHPQDTPKPGSASQPVVIMPTSDGRSSFPGVVADPHLKLPEAEDYDSRIPSILKRLEQRSDGSFSALITIAKKVQEMEEDILKFTGKHGDQEYVYLEEMLTRQLLALDQILAEGDDEIRTSRRSLVREVQDLLEILEKRAKV